MRFSTARIAALIPHVVLCLAAQAVYAHPCTGVDRSLREGQKAALAPVLEAHAKAQLDTRVAAQVTVRPNDVLATFRVGRWQIMHVNDHATDDLYLFYSTDPTRLSRFVGVWGGAAGADEGPGIEAWAMREMPGIPRTLARCFAWYVTRGIAE